MDIREFVATALTEIIEGIKDAQGNGDDGRLVNAAPGSATMDGHLFRGSFGTFSRVDFDLAVTAETKTDRGGEAKLTVVGVGFGGKAGTASTTQSVSRLSFSVPVQLPDGDQSRLEEQSRVRQQEMEEATAAARRRREAAERERV